MMRATLGAGGFTMQRRFRIAGLAWLCGLPLSVCQAATFTVTSTAASGTGSLSAAITQANGAVGADTINFGIAGTGVKVLAMPSGGLPTVTDTLVINGYTQTGAAQNTTGSGATNAVLRIELDATGMVQAQTVLRLGAATTVRGLAINNMALGVIPIAVQSNAGGSAIHGCFIGTDAAGTASGDGGGVDISAGTQIGSSAAADRNLFAGTSGGVFVSNGGTAIQGNLFGTFANGTTGGNQGLGQGVVVRATANTLLIGGTSGHGNIFRDISGIGIRLFSTDPAPVGITIQGNSIDGVTGLPIDLGSDGVDPIDAGDGDDGPNHRENTAQMLYARRQGTQLAVQLFIDGNFSGGGKRVELYASTDAHPSGSGPGAIFLAAFTANPGQITTRAFFDISTTATAVTGLVLPQVVTATVTGADGSTSEFSNAVALEEGGALRTVINTNDSGTGSLRQQLLDANGNAGADTIAFNIPGSGPHTIAPITALPASTGPLIIDGYTENSSLPNTALIGSNASLQIALDGSGLGGTPLLAASGGTATVRGLNLRNSGNAGIALTGGTGHVVEGCFIGTTVDGAAAATNLGNGVTVNSTVSGVRIGGPGLHQRNLVSGNGAAGINAGGNDVVIENNVIGTAANGTTVIGNVFGGVFAAGTGGVVVNNRVRGNGSRGIGIATATAQVDVRGNAVFSNFGQGIDLNNDGLTPNDTNDVDSGPNGLQNFPVLSGALALAGGSLRINGTLDRPALGTHAFRFDVFASTACDSGGNGEGEIFLGSTTLLFNAAAPETFQFDLPDVSVAAGSAITATATTGAGETSEFSPCFSSTVQPQAVFANGFE